MNYAYSWGAAIVIAGTLFKLTHLPGANLMLWIGMGTEVLVFFISMQEIVSTAAVVMDFKSGGKGVAVGKVSERDSTFEVAENWDVKVYGMLLKEYIQQFAKTMYPVGSIYMSVNATNPSTYFPLCMV